MADASNPHQRNLYQQRFNVLTYRDGRGKTYDTQLKKLSWPINTDVPTHAQDSSTADVQAGAYNTLHPMEFTHNAEKYESSFANSYGNFGMHVDAARALPVHERLFTPSKSQARVPGSPTKCAVSQAELLADQYMSDGEYGKAIHAYTQAISQKASLFCYEKRCAAFAHVGRYHDALRDAQHIAANGPSGETESGPARRRIKALEDFMANSNNFKVGYKEGAATLVTLLTPKTQRQWRSGTPSAYSRPYPFGESGRMALTGYGHIPYY